MSDHLQQIQRQLDDRYALLRNLTGDRRTEVQGQIDKLEADRRKATGPVTP